MAVLSVDSLTGCSSIPSFLGGSADTPANPTISIFRNTSAPTNWTKNTSASINDISLRVIGGAEGTAISSGGSLSFSTVFSPKTSPIASTSTTAGISINSNPANAPASTNSGTSSIQPATLSSSQNPPHNHVYSKNPGPAPTAARASPGGVPAGAAAQGPLTSGTMNGPGTHTHPLSNPHTHSVSDPGHSHPINATGSHSHTFTLNQDFNILYVDVIIATKN